MLEMKNSYELNNDNMIKIALQKREILCNEIREYLSMEGNENNRGFRIKAIVNKVRFNEEEQRFYVSGDLLTDKLEEYDELFFGIERTDSTNANAIHLRPIYFGFEAEYPYIAFNEKYRERILGNYMNKARTLGIEPFSLDILIKLYNDFKYREKEAESIYDFIHYCLILSKSFKGTIDEQNMFCEDLLAYCCFEVGFDNSIKHPVNVFFAASPFMITRKCISFINRREKYKKEYFSKILPQMKQYNVISPLNISNVLPNFQPRELKEYNVGQGNFSEVSDGNDQIIVFDVGFTTLEQHTGYSCAMKELQRVNAQCYIISHFDLDHIIGSIYLADTQFEKSKLWIIPLPEQKGISLSAQRLIYYLHLNACLRVVDFGKNNNSVFLFNNSIKIYQGTGSDKNNSGILIYVQGKSNTALLTGDCSYKYFSQSVPTKCDYLVVPHHGEKVNAIPVKASSTDAVAIIPVGNNNYGHPNCCHVCLLQRNGFAVKRMDEYPPILYLKYYL